MTRRLSALRVGNFKAFADTQRIPLKPITLIFGPNSAGKSSFIHSLALAHEAQFGREKRSLARLDVHHTDIGGSSIDLGGFRQYVHRKQLNRRVEWGVDVNSSALGGSIATKLLPTRVVCYSITFGMELDDQDMPRLDAKPQIVALDISDGKSELLHASRRPQGVYRIDRINLRHPFFEASILELFQFYDPGPTEGESQFIETGIKNIEAALPKLSLKLNRCLPNEVVIPDSWDLEGLDNDAPPDGVLFFIEEQLTPFIKALSAAIESSLNSFQYLGPLRSYPARHLAFSDHDDRNWYAGGGYAWDVVRRNDSVREAVNAWLGSSKLKTPYKLVVRSLVALDQLQAPLEEGLEALQAEGIDMEPDYDGKSSNPVGAYPVIKDIEAEAERLLAGIDASDAERIRELVLVDQRTHTAVTHRDVGIGISQVLPVLVLAYGSQGKLLAMEQPEIHLHPALQAELGDVFIEAALGERQNTFILETHSEHLILRLMRRIREGKVSPDDVGVIFVEPLARGSRFIELRIDEDGDFIDEWPGGFFEESYHEKFAGR